MGLCSSVIGFCLLCILPAVSTAYAATGGTGVKAFHLDRSNLPGGCASCHMGSDFTKGGGPQKCITCHGPFNQRSSRSKNQKVELKDISGEFAKNYRHPTFDKPGIHRTREILPETDPGATRHAECSDCHSPHFISSENRFAGIKGKKVGNFVTEISKETELCYLCHADSANMLLKSTNKRLEFTITNASFHPVEAEGKNLSVVSLIRPYREKKIDLGDVSMLKCVDCHASDDPNAPRGPHGSKYEGLLVENYYTGDGIQENSFAYALCYRCHKRTSILGNESFVHHSRHIEGSGDYKENGITKSGGTSCYTCHNSHGVVENRNLIRFNREVVTESSAGQLKFVEKGVSTFHGECWLTCHGVDHNPKSY